MPLMTRKEWAASEGFSVQYVFKLIKSGTVRLVDGKIDPDQARRALEAIRNPAKPLERKGVPVPQATPRPYQVPTPPPPVQRLADRAVSHAGAASDNDLTTMLLKARVKNEIARGISLGVRAALDSKEAINAREAEEAWASWVREFRSSIEAWPNRVAGIMAAELDVDAKKLRIIMEKHLRALLFEIAGKADESDG